MLLILKTIQLLEESLFVSFYMLALFTFRSIIIVSSSPSHLARSAVINVVLFQFLPGFGSNPLINTEGLALFPFLTPFILSTI